MTSTEPALCTSAPTTGSSAPVIASTMAAKLSAMEKVMFRRMVAHHALCQAQKVRYLADVVVDQSVSAASTAMSLPTPPMATPTWARLSAGASLTPSADHADLPAGLLARVDIGELVLRETAGAVFADAEAGGDGCGGVFVIAVSSTGSAPASRTRRTVSRASGRSVSERAMKPA